MKCGVCSYNFKKDDTILECNGCGYVTCDNCKDEHSMSREKTIYSLKEYEKHLVVKRLS